MGFSLCWPLHWPNGVDNLLPFQSIYVEVSFHRYNMDQNTRVDFPGFPPADTWKLTTSENASTLLRIECIPRIGYTLYDRNVRPIFRYKSIIWHSGWTLKQAKSSGDKEWILDFILTNIKFHGTQTSFSGSPWEIIAYK